MSVTDPEAGELFVYRITKSLAANPERRWANSYEFIAVEAGSTSDLLTLMTTIINFEATMSLATTRFERGTVSTWVADSHPYDPTAFLSTTLTASGVQTDTGNGLNLQTCLSVARDVIGGRVGHLFLRNFLRESDVSAPSGVSKLDDRAAQQTLLETAIIDTNFDTYMEEGLSRPFCMVMINKDGSNMRRVQHLRVAGVAQVPINHKWYNRTTGPVVTE